MMLHQIDFFFIFHVTEEMNDEFIKKYLLQIYNAFTKNIISKIIWSLWNLVFLRYLI